MEGAWRGWEVPWAVGVVGWRWGGGGEGGRKWTIELLPRQQGRASCWRKAGNRGGMLASAPLLLLAVAERASPPCTHPPTHAHARVHPHPPTRTHPNTTTPPTWAWQLHGLNPCTLVHAAALPLAPVPRQHRPDLAVVVPGKLGNQAGQKRREGIRWGSAGNQGIRRGCQGNQGIRRGWQGAGGVWCALPPSPPTQQHNTTQHTYTTTHIHRPAGAKPPPTSAG